MKVVFNFNGRTRSPRRSILVGLAALLAVLVLHDAPARAQATYWTTRDLLTDFFPRSAHVTWRKVEIDPATRQHLEERLGYRLTRSSYLFYVATSATGAVDGYAFIDDEPGQHLPITFAVKISPAGTVERQEIVAYREARGDEVRDARFRAQFVGKSARDSIRPGDDVVAVSGATISSRAMSVGVKRALVLLDELVLRPAAVAAARASR
jgi:hypothetical protein